MGTGELQMKTIVIGDLMLDKYVFGIVERVSPESGCPILKQTTCEYQLGEPTLKSKACLKCLYFMAISRKIFTSGANCYVSLSMTTLVMLDSKYAPF